jgi:AcrR family transcriptional regulator
VTDDRRTTQHSSIGDQRQQPRRDEIMTAAKKVFARNGFDGTTIAGIAKEAGLPFDVVYQYFDSKDALFQALIAAQEYALRTHVAVALAASGASFGYAEVPFRAALRAMLEYFDADPAATRLLFRDAYTKNSRFNERLGGFYERYTDDIEALVVAAQRRGDIMAAPSRLVAYTLTVLIGQIVHRRLTTDDGITAAEAADFIVSLVMKGLRPD